MPPPLRARIEFGPALPPAHAAARERIVPGRLIKCTAVYAEPFWRDEGLSGESLSDAGPATLTFDNSPPGGSPGVLVGFVGGADARRHAALGTSQRRREVLECFARLFGPRALEAERFIELDWARERWSAGGPTSNMPPGAWTSVGTALREPAGRVHWAGTETAGELVGLHGRSGAIGRARRRRGRGRALTPDFTWRSQQPLANHPHPRRGAPAPARPCR